MATATNLTEFCNNILNEWSAVTASRSGGRAMRLPLLEILEMGKAPESFFYQAAAIFCSMEELFRVLLANRDRHGVLGRLATTANNGGSNNNSNAATPFYEPILETLRVEKETIPSLFDPRIEPEMYRPDFTPNIAYMLRLVEFLVLIGAPLEIIQRAYLQHPPAKSCATSEDTADALVFASSTPDVVQFFLEMDPESAIAVLESSEFMDFRNTSALRSNEAKYYQLMDSLLINGNGTKNRVSVCIRQWIDQAHIRRHEGNPARRPGLVNQIIPADLIPAINHGPSTTTNNVVCTLKELEVTFALHSLESLPLTLDLLRYVLHMPLLETLIARSHHVPTTNEQCERERQLVTQINPLLCQVVQETNLVGLEVFFHDLGFVFREGRNDGRNYYYDCTPILNALLGNTTLKRCRYSTTQKLPEDKVAAHEELALEVLQQNHTLQSLVVLRVDAEKSLSPSRPVWGDDFWSQNYWYTALNRCGRAVASNLLETTPRDLVRILESATRDNDLCADPTGLKLISVTVELLSLSVPVWANHNNNNNNNNNNNGRNNHRWITTNKRGKKRKFCS